MQENSDQKIATRRDVAHDKPLSRRLNLRIESVMGKTAIASGGLDEARSSNSPLSGVELFACQTRLIPLQKHRLLSGSP
jgi:hypothetical protein